MVKKIDPGNAVVVGVVFIKLFVLSLNDQSRLPKKRSR